MSRCEDSENSVFLEISIDATQEKKLSKLEILGKIGAGFRKLYGKNYQLISKDENPYIRVDFPNQKAFEKIYEKPYSMYVFIFEEFVQENLSIENLFANSSLQKSVKFQEEQEENYLVLRYKSNCLEPMRQYYEFTEKVNKFFGSKVYNEELYNGYLRFINTKEDFEILLLPGDMKHAWRETFKIRKVDENHPLIQKFFSSIEKWKNEVWNKRQETKKK